MLEYILCISDELELNCLTKNNALLLVNKYIKSKALEYNDDLQMTCLVCLHLSVMIFESSYSGHDLMHTYSRHNYKQSELVRQEGSVL